MSTLQCHILMALVAQCYKYMAGDGLGYGVLTDYTSTWLLNADKKGLLNVSDRIPYDQKGQGDTLSVTEVQSTSLATCNHFQWQHEPCANKSQVIHFCIDLACTTVTVHSQVTFADRSAAVVEVPNKHYVQHVAICKLHCQSIQGRNGPRTL